LKTLRKRLEKPRENTGQSMAGRKNDLQTPSRDPNQLAKS